MYRKATPADCAGAHRFYSRQGMRCSHYCFTLPL